MADTALTRVLAALLTLAALALMAWMELPPWQREMTARAARTRLHQLAGAAARASGHRAMGRELAGTPEHDAGYDLTERLSRLRDRL
jgi:hypothetical protein